MADFLNVPIVETGEFDALSGPISITRGRIDDMVEASRADPNFRAPIKLGHDPDQPLLDTDGLPAAGWVENLRRIGDTLIADLLEVPDKIASLMENGTLRNRSVEIMFDFKIAGRVFPAVLTGLALLGEVLPAITSLDDVVKLYASRNLKPEEGAAFSVGLLGHLTADYIRKLPDMAFASKAEGGHLRQLPHHTFQQGAVDRLLVLRSITDLPNVRAPMALKRRMLKHLGEHASREGMDLTNEITGVSEALMEDELRKILGLGESGDVLDAIKGLMALSASIRTSLKIDEDADIGEALTAALAAKKEPDTTPAPKDTPKPKEGESAEMTTLKTELATTQAAVLTLQGTAGMAVVTKAVDDAIESGQLLPAQREASLKLATTNMATFTAFLESQPKGMVELGARGDQGSGADVDMAAIEPTETQWKTAQEMGLATPEHRLSLMRANAAEKHITLPANFGQEKEKIEAKA